MSPQDRSSPLVEAVEAFDAELARFAKAASAACRRELDSARDLDAAAASLKEAADAETAMQMRAKALVGALQSAQAEQQRQAEALRARSEEVQRRVEVYEALADRYRQIGAAAGTLADDATRLSDDPAGAAGRATPEVLGALQGFDGRIAELQQTARGLATDAREQGFEDLGRQAHALDQTLSSLRNKLNLAQRAAAPAGGRHTSEN